MKYFDSHAHYYDERFISEYDGSVDDLIGALLSSEVSHVINVGTSPKTSRLAIEQAAKFDRMYTALGVHQIHLCLYLWKASVHRTGSHQPSAHASLFDATRPARHRPDPDLGRPWSRTRLSCHSCRDALLRRSAPRLLCGGACGSGDPLALFVGTPRALSAAAHHRGI